MGSQSVHLDHVRSPYRWTYGERRHQVPGRLRRFRSRLHGNLLLWCLVQAISQLLV